MSIYKKRREQLLERDKNSVYVVFSNDLMRRSHDTDFPFRQDSNFYYLTGFNEPDCALILCSARKTSQLFLRESDPIKEMWDGKRLGVKDAVKALDIDEAHNIDDFEKEISSYLIGHQNLFVDMLGHKSKFQILQNVLDKLSKLRKIKEGSPTSIHSLSEVMGEMRKIKSDDEITLMRKASEISSETHNNLMKICRPGMNEADLSNFIKFNFTRRGASHTAYENIVASGNNANILHYNENDSELRDGDLVLIDAGSEYNLYASDITRTFPVNGRFNPEQKEIYQLVLDTQKSCIEMVRPGVTIIDLHEHSAKLISQGLMDLGIIQEKSLDKVLEDKLFREYYPHGLGHWIGIDVHDPCPYFNEDRSDMKLEAGMLITVEPGVYLNANNSKVPAKYRGIGVRIEDDILVTENGHDNLTKNTVKEIADVEATCASSIDQNLFTY